MPGYCCDSSGGFGLVSVTGFTAACGAGADGLAEGVAAGGCKGRFPDCTGAAGFGVGVTTIGGGANRGGIGRGRLGISTGVIGAGRGVCIGAAG